MCNMLLTGGREGNKALGWTNGEKNHIGERDALHKNFESFIWHLEKIDSKH